MDDYIYSQSVHKDFYIVMNYLIKFIRENYEEKYLESFFNNSAAYIYKPLINRIRDNGLIEIKKHLEKIFSIENGEFNLSFRENEDKLIFEVKKCPAICYMKNNKIEIDKDFCKYSTEVVNKSIAKECNYNFKVDYNQENGSCIQIFWKEGK